MYYLPSPPPPFSKFRRDAKDGIQTNPKDKNQVSRDIKEGRATNLPTKNLCYDIFRITLVDLLPSSLSDSLRAKFAWHKSKIFQNRWIYLSLFFFLLISISTRIHRFRTFLRFHVYFQFLHRAKLEYSNIFLRYISSSIIIFHRQIFRLNIRRFLSLFFFFLIEII